MFNSNKKAISLFLFSWTLYVREIMVFMKKIKTESLSSFKNNGLDIDNSMFHKLLCQNWVFTINTSLNTNLKMPIVENCVWMCVCMNRISEELKTLKQFNYNLQLVMFKACGSKILLKLPFRSITTQKILKKSLDISVNFIY